MAGFVMGLHELCTNAAKYGALSSPAGEVLITWSTSQDNLEFSWVERGGPPVQDIAPKGFGTRLLRSGLASGGTADLDLAPEGVTFRLTMRLAAHQPI